MNIEEKSVILIQRIFRGYLCRRDRLPTFLYVIQKYLSNYNIKFSNIEDDGRINSCIDETEIILILLNEFNIRIKKPLSRCWYDILINDYLYGWLPVNIKSTTTKTNDNSGNLTMCVYSYTNYNLDINTDKSYTNGEMSKILVKKLKNKEYNYINKRDYYFIVVNKQTNEIIINSLKGLSLLTPNINNLPFQICWSKNKDYKYNKIDDVINKFILCIKKSKPSWRDIFINEMRNMTIT